MPHQQLPGSSAPPRPKLAIRIGVTGSRVLPDGRAQALHTDVLRILGFIRTQIELIANDQDTRGLYDTGTPPCLTLSSALAEGADRLVARAGLEAGFTLRAILPFDREEYLHDCVGQDSQDDLNSLLGEAGGGIVELDGGREQYQIDSYEAAGHLVVRTSDLMIAIWDHSDGRRGGTEWVMRYAQLQGVPVWWIHTDGTQPASLIYGRTRLSVSKAHNGEEAVLAEYLRRLLVPPRPGLEHPSAILESLGRLSHSLAPEPARLYLASKHLPERAYWRAYSWWLGASNSNSPSIDARTDYWTEPMQPADRRATDYGQRIRSGYLWVSALTLISVVLAALTPFLHHHFALEVVLTILEIGALGVICALLFGRHWHDWRRRWQDCRRLAEALRSRRLLTPFADESPGWSRNVVYGLIRQSSGIPQSPEQAINRSMWVDWLISAYVRAAPPISVRFSAGTTNEARNSAIAFLCNQKIYHKDSADRAHRADAVIRWMDELLLPGIIALIIIKLCLVWSTPGHSGIGFLAFLATILPVFALNVVSVRAAWHLHLNAARSAAMADAMEDAVARLKAVDASLPLASQDLSTIAMDVATAMARDTDARFELAESD